VGSAPIRRRGARRPRWVIGAVVALVVSFGAGTVEVGGPPAGAQLPPVMSDGSRARVWGLRLGGGFDLVADVDRSAGSWSCWTATFDIDDALVDAPVHGVLPPDVVFLPAPVGVATFGRYWVTCVDGLGGRFDEIGWIADIVDVDAEVWSFAAWYLAEVAPPPMAIGVSPAGRAVVGTETWFWIEGYRGAPLFSRHDVVGFTVDVRFDLVAVDWDYGDGTGDRLGPQGLGVPGARGAPWRRYTHRSTVPSPDAALTVAATARFDISYTFEGRGPFRVDPPVTSTVDRPLVVREAQALLD